MRHVYIVVEKNEDSTTLVVYATFQKAVSISKQLLKQEFEYIQSSYEEKDLQQDFFENTEKEIYEASIYNEYEVFYRVNVKKILVIE
jgi:hypothetical protein